MFSGCIKFFYIALFLVFLCFLTYRTSLSNEFLLDDFAIVLNQPRGFDNLGRALSFGDAEHIFYRPVSNVLRLALVSFLPTDAVYFHAVNILLFSIHVVLVFFALQVLFKNVRLAFMASLLYAVHPINGVAGNYVTGQEIPFFAIWLDLSLLLLIYFLDAQYKKRFYYASIFFFALALLSQEVAISFVLLVLLILFQFRRDLTFREAFRLSLPYLVLATGYVLSRKFLVTQTIERAVGYSHAMRLDIPAYLNTVFDLIGWYLQQLVYPSGIILAKTLAPQTSGFLAKMIGLACAALAGFFLFRRCWKGNPVLFGIVWLLSGFIPLFAVALMFSYNDFIIEPHWFFFSSIGFFVTVAYILDRSFRTARSDLQKSSVMVLLVLMTSSGFYVSQVYNQIWQHQKSYCRYWLSLAPNHYFPNYWLARSYFAEKAYDQAEYHFKKSFTGKKNDWYVYAGLGDVEAERGRFERTKYYYEQALKLNPKEPRLRHNVQWIDEEFARDDRTTP